MAHPRRGLVLVVTIVLALAACSSDSDTGTSSTTAAGPTSPTGESTTTSTQATSTSTTQATTTEATTTTQTTTTTEATTTTTQATPTTGVAGAGSVAYFMLESLDDRGPFLVPVYRDTPSGGTPIAAAVDALLAGPTPDEGAATPSITTAIPAGTAVLGVNLRAGVATVDLNGDFDDGGGSFSMFARLAQVVYTVTRIDGVDSVVFHLDGEPITVFSSEGIELDGAQERSDYYDLLPLIFVDDPAWGETVTSPIPVSGLSNVFEAVSQVMLTDDDGAPLFEQSVMATCGTGCWGEWEVQIPYSIDRDQFGSLIVWEFSAKDGSRINIREYPLQLR